MLKINLEHFQKEIVYPAVLSESENYIIKLAETDEELQQTLKLRYKVFNIEQGKGLQTAQISEIDLDEFDEFCLQLMIVSKKDGLPVATYRIHLGSVATKAKGFYSATEYNIKGMDLIASKSIEVGRSCVLPEFRTGGAIALLWSGIGELMLRAKMRYLFGCASLEEYCPAATWAMYRYFCENGKKTDIIEGTPREKFILEPSPEEEIKKYYENMTETVKVYQPPLLKGYLRLGSKIAGPPVFDPDFGTIDFLVILDTYTVPDKYKKHYNYNPIQNQ